MDVDEMDTEQYAPESHGVDHSTENYENLDDLEENDEMTAEQVLEALENAWLDEKFAPELLPPQLEIVECMLQQIAHMEENLKRLQKGDIRINIHTMEISRIRFMISSYLRTRLDKIEEFAIHLVTPKGGNQKPEETLMTQAETRFAKEYLTGVESLFKSLALNFLPHSMNGMDCTKVASKPNMNKHVFARANKSISGILIPRAGGNDLEVDFEKGSQHIVRYSTIAHLVKSGDVQLI